MARSHQAMTGAFTVPVEGAVLCGETRAGATGGAKSPLVLVHGMAGERHDWDRLCNALPSSLATLRYDLRGFGASVTQQDTGFSHAEDLLALFDALGIDRAPLAGLSMGGGIALNFALNHPERVSRLVLISPAMIGWEWSEEWRAIWRGITGAARSGDMALARERWWNHPIFATARQSDAAGELRRSIGAYHGRQWVRDYQRDALPDMERLHQLAMPTLLLTGELDQPDLRLIGDVIESAAPNVRRIDYPGAGHMLHLERTAEVARAIADFLR